MQCFKLCIQFSSFAWLPYPIFSHLSLQACWDFRLTVWQVVDVILSIVMDQRQSHLWSAASLLACEAWQLELAKSQRPRIISLCHDTVADAVSLIGIALTLGHPSYTTVSILCLLGSNSYLRNIPLKSLPALIASSAMTSPGLLGANNFPSFFNVENLVWSFSSMFLRNFSLISPCMAVSTTPGLIETVVTSGSSFFSVSVRWLMAALVAP